jgi:hypothetical protein
LCVSWWFDLFWLISECPGPLESTPSSRLFGREADCTTTTSTTTIRPRSQLSRRWRGRCRASMSQHSHSRRPSSETLALAAMRSTSPLPLPLIKPAGKNMHESIALPPIQSLTREFPSRRELQQQQQGFQRESVLALLFLTASRYLFKLSVFYSINIAHHRTSTRRRTSVNDQGSPATTTVVRQAPTSGDESSLKRLMDPSMTSFHNLRLAQTPISVDTANSPLSMNGPRLPHSSHNALTRPITAMSVMPVRDQIYHLLHTTLLRNKSKFPHQLSSSSLRLPLLQVLLSMSPLQLGKMNLHRVSQEGYRIPLQPPAKALPVVSISRHILPTVALLTA